MHVKDSLTLNQISIVISCLDPPSSVPYFETTRLQEKKTQILVPHSLGWLGHT